MPPDSTVVVDGAEGPVSVTEPPGNPHPLVIRHVSVDVARVLLGEGVESEARERHEPDQRLKRRCGPHRRPLLNE